MELLHSDPLDLRRQINIKLCNAPAVVGAKGEGDAAVVDRDVRVVVDGGGRLSDLFHQPEGVNERVESLLLAYGVALPLPARQVFQGLLDVGVGEFFCEMAFFVSFQGVVCGGSNVRIVSDSITGLITVRLRLLTP